MHKYELTLVDDGDEKLTVTAVGGRDLTSKMIVAFRHGLGVYVEQLPDSEPHHTLQWEIDHAEQVIHG